MVNEVEGAEHFCRDCAHYRRRPTPALFAPSAMSSPGVLKARLEWDQLVRQRAEEELRRLRANEDFDYEPHHYAWCAAYTADLKHQRSVVIDPVSGEVRTIYALCTRKNPNGECPRYQGPPAVGAPKNP